MIRRHSRLAAPRHLARWRAALPAGVLLLTLAACQPGGDPVAAGREHMKSGQYPAAVIEFKNAVQAQPESVEARVLLADALERVNDLVGAEQQLRKALDGGGDANLLVPRIALIMLDRSDLEKLARDFKDRRLDDRTADSTLRATVAIAYAGLKRLPLAEAQLQGVVDTPTVVLARSQLLVAKGQLREAAAQLATLDPKVPAPWWVLRAAARVAGAGGDANKALESIARAHQAVPWHRGVTGEYGEALVAAGRADEAAAVRDQLRKEAPKHFWTYYLDALLLARAGQHEASHAAAIKVLSVAPEHLPATLLAASAELQDGDVAMAHKRLMTLAQKHPDSLPALRLLAQAQWRLGKRTEAAETTQRGLRLRPADAQLLALRAEIELARGEGKQAIATLSQVLAAHAGDAQTQLRLGEVQASLGQRQAATEWLERAAAATTDPALQGRVVASALRLGNAALARQLAEQGVAEQPGDPRSQLTLAATQSASKDAAGAWATTLAVLDKHPTHAGALAALAAMTRTPKQREELVSRHARAVDARTDSPQVYLQYAALLRAQPEGTQTPRLVLEKGVAALPGAVAVREALTQEYLRAGEADKAISLAQTGAAATNAPPAAAALLAATYERMGKTQLATEAYRKLAADYPQRADWRLKLAELEAASNRVPQAVSLLRALVTERPFDVSAYVALANLTLRDKPDEALSIARQMAQREELKTAAQLLEGDILAKTGQADEALKQFSRMAKAAPSPAASLRVVRVLDQAGRGAAADQELAAALKRFPADASVVGAAAARALAAGKPAQSVELLQRLAARMPPNPVLLNDLAWAQLQAGRPEALPNARLAAAGLPYNANVLDTLGLALAASGQRDEAIANLRAAAHLAPLAALPRLHLGEQLLAAGDRSGAAAAVQAVDKAQLGEKDQVRFDKLKGSLATL